MKNYIWWMSAVCAGGLYSSSPAQVVDLAKFDFDGNGKLDKRELALFVAKRDNLKPNIAAFLSDAGKLTVAPEKLEGAIEQDLRSQAADAVGEIVARLDGDSPYAIADVRQVLAPPAVVPESSRLRLPGALGQKTVSSHGSMGPLLLRKSVDDGDKDLKNSAGAKLAHSRNRLTDKSTWVTEGALLFPMAGWSNERRADRLSERWSMLLSASWKVVQVGQTTTGDAEELQFQAPFMKSINRGDGSALRNAEYKVTPYFLTDFGFRGKVAGASFSYTPYVKPASGGVEVNTGYRFVSETSPLLYRLGLVPTLDYNHLFNTSRFITRTSHKDYFRGGGRAEIGLLTHTLPAIELRATYSGFWRIDGAPSQSDLLSLTTKLWLNPNAAVTLEHQKGDTPVATKEVDVTTLGLELRF